MHHFSHLLQMPNITRRCEIPC